MKVIAVNYNLVFCMVMAASPTFKLLTTALKALLHQQFEAFRQKDEAKQSKVVLSFLKGLVYLTVLLNLLPSLVNLQNSWGQLPTWLADQFEEIIYTMLLIPLVYSYELTASPTKIPWTMWFHHGAAIVICILGLSKGHAGGEQTEATDESSSFIACLFCYSACMTVSLDFIFFILLGFYNMAERARTKELLIRSAIGPYCVTCTSIDVALFSVLAYHREFLASSPALEFAMWFILMFLIPEQVFPLQTLLSMARKLHKQAEQEALEEQGQASAGNSGSPQAGFARRIFSTSKPSILTVAAQQNPRRRQSRRFQAM